MIELNAGGATDAGVVRSENEDAFVILHDAYVVADGMGGHLGGEVASTIATETFSRYIEGVDPVTTTDLIEAVNRANEAIYERGQSDPSVHGLGTTFTALATVLEDGENRIGIIHVGDSRAYVMRDGQLQQLTNDHSLVEELIRTGQLTPKEAEDHPRKNIITRALGIEVEVKSDLVQVLPFKGDRYLLCSDGLVGEVTDDQIASVMRRLADPTEASPELVAKAKENGGSDNITVVIVDVRETDVDETAVARQAVPVIKSEDSPEETDAPQNVAPNSAILSSSTINAKPSNRANIEGRPFITPRVIAFLFLFLLVLGAAGLFVASYATRAYYVGVNASNQIVVYKGRPGGVLWVKPKLVETRSFTLSDIPLDRQEAVKDGKVVDTKADADRFIENILAEASGFGGTTTSVTTSPTTITPVP